MVLKTVLTCPVLQCTALYIVSFQLSLWNGEEEDSLKAGSTMKTSTNGECSRKIWVS